ncbi:MAG TPA: N-acetylmuramoyl-L-alanine amidase [Rhizomicrobium sp.]|nr:N-acetylmuramoyl-L-alanine amidase [Rhizomicrobium sp.]
MRPIQRPSPNRDSRGAARVDMLVLHYTGMKTAEEALARLCDPAAKVSAHYTVDRDGTVYAHVPEELRAWHAGASYWAGERNVNARSIGIELVNPGHAFGYIPFAEAQIEALVELARGILSRHPIAPSRVVGHSDVAPSRKLDPGELFPWQRLAQSGIGIWPAPRAPSGDFASGLARFGYGAPPQVDWTIQDTIKAFQRHFRPSCIDGMADAECERLLAGLLGS